MSSPNLENRTPSPVSLFGPGAVNKDAKIITTTSSSEQTVDSKINSELDSSKKILTTKSMLFDEEEDKVNVDDSGDERSPKHSTSSPQHVSHPVISPPKRSFFITDILSENRSPENHSQSFSAFRPLRVPSHYLSPRNNVTKDRIPPHPFLAYGDLARQQSLDEMRNESGTDKDDHDDDDDDDSDDMGTDGK